jgi:hypothetical protein
LIIYSQSILGKDIIDRFSCITCGFGGACPHGGLVISDRGFPISGCRQSESKIGGVSHGEVGAIATKGRHDMSGIAE